MKIIAILFSIIYVVISIGMLVPAKEDGALAYGALGFLITSLFLLWFFRSFFERKQLVHKILWFTIVAICITSVSIPAYWIAQKNSSIQDATLETNFRNTQVKDFHDEVLFTEKNNPIGIRLRYAVIVPQTGRYFPQPSVSDGKSRVGGFMITTIKIDPLPKQLEYPNRASGKYVAGISYNVTADISPNFLLPDNKTGNLCAYIKDMDEENLIKNAKSEQMEVDIQGTSFSRYYGQGVHYLENKYNPKDFYESIPKENIPKCAF